MEKHVCRTLLILSLLFLSTTSFSQIHISGPQSGVLPDTTYIVDGDISVQEGDSLIIDQGAVFLFDGDFKFEILGFLLAIGTQEDSIVFLPNSGVASWQGIDFANSSSDSCLLRYCLVQGSNDSGIEIHQCGPTIDHCTIRRNSGGGNWEAGVFVTTSSSPVFSNCLIAENKGIMGGGISVSFCSAEALPVFRNCIVTNNYADSEGGGINVESSSSHAILDHCLFAFNVAAHRGGGIDICSGNALVRNCTIVGNKCDQGYGAGIHVNTTGVSTEISNCIIAHNSMGGGIGFPSSNIQATLEYSCLYNNQGGNFSRLPQDSLGITVMTNANGDSCDMFYNILKNPTFFDAHHKNFRLQAMSACIDAGNPASPLDPDSTIADIGAYYYDQSPTDGLIEEASEPQEFQLLSAYPNPFNSVTLIQYNLSEANQIQLRVDNILGQQIAILFEGIQQAGRHTVAWNADAYPSGIYFAQLQGGHDVKVIKMVLLK